jgi:hypothetical protein
MQRKDALNTHTVGPNSTHGDGTVRLTAAQAHHDPFKGLGSLTISLNNSKVNPDRVSRSNFRKVLLHLLALDSPQKIGASHSVTSPQLMDSICGINTKDNYSKC